MYESVPDELKDLQQWCCFRLVFDKKRGKYTKVPYNAMTGEKAKSNDESTWADFETALDSSKQFDGIGFFFKEPYFGIDLDDVADEIARYKNGDHEGNIVSEFIETMGSYTEYSPSGKGIHIIVKGDLPEGGRRKGNVEMYDSGRFFTVTGNAASDFRFVTEDDYGRIGYLHNKYIAKKETKTESKPIENTTSGNSLQESELIRIAENSKNGMRFKLFMEGGWEQFYSSQSEADMAFANDLAFWTAMDFSKMDSIFRASSLMRDKWDSKREKSTYGIDTLNKAIRECTNIFRPAEPEDDFNLYVLDQDAKQVERKFFSYDDTGNAERFTYHNGKDVRYSFVKKKWLHYSPKEGVWKTDMTGEVKRMVDDTLKKMKTETVYVAESQDEEEAKKAFEKHLKSSRSSRGKMNMLKEAEHLLAIAPDTFDTQATLLNVQNGYLDLETGILHDHEREKFFTKVSGVEYTDKSDCPQWLEFLNQTFDYDQRLIDYIQRAIGYSLSGSTEEQVMFILYGNGRNGKSVFLDIITDLFGNYAINIQPETIMVKQMSNGATGDIARLNGARFVTTTEPNEGVRMNEGLVKQLTGGDKITARFLFEDEIEFRPEFKLWMATNHKPIIRGTDEGIWRRLSIIPFTNTIPKNKVDKQLKDKLKTELNAILNWAVDGYILWRQMGLAEPQTIEDQRKQYRTEMDVCEAFIEDCCVKDESQSIKAKILYLTYKEWAKENGQYEMSSTKFGREMGLKFPKKNSNGIWYVGLTLTEEADRTGFRISY